MADDVNIRVVTEDDSTAVWQELYKMFGDTQEQLDKLAVSAESLGFQSAAGQAETLGNEVEAVGKKANETSSIFGQLGQAIMQGLGLGAGLSVFAGITSGIQSLVSELKSTITEASTAQEAQAKLNAILSATGETSGITAGQVNDLATEMQRLTRFEDDTVVSASTVMLTFRTISSTTFPQAMKAAADLAAMWGMDLTSAARMVGRALDAPGEGLGMLTRLGVRFTDQQKEMLQQLTATGRGAEAQAQILDILNSKFGGTAQAMVNTYAGRMEQLKNTFGNIKEEIGGAFLPVLEDLAKALTETFEGQGSAVTAFANGLKDAIYEIRQRWTELVLQFAQFGEVLNFLKSLGPSFANFWINAIDLVGLALLRLAAQSLQVGAIIKGNLAQAADYGAQAAAMTAEMAAKSTALGAALSGQASEMGVAWDAMLGRLQALQLQIDATIEKARGYGISRAPADASRGAGGLAQGYMSPTPPADAINAAKIAGREVGNSYGDAFKAAVKKSDIPGYMESDIKSAQDKLKGLVPEMFPDLTAPGANGPFENIFRAADVAKRGADSPWAKALGLTQEQAREIVQKFGAGIIDESVKGLIDIKALQENVKLKQMATTMTKKFADELGGAMTSSSELQTAGTNAITTLKAGIDRVSPGLVDGLETTITTPIIQAFDAATTAVNTLIAALERLKAMGAKPPTGAGAGGGAPEGTSGRMFGGIPAYARARGYS